MQLMELKYKQDRRFSSTEANKKEMMKREREKINYLKRRIEQRNQLVDEVKEAWKEDAETRKEISQLRKIDQEENYQRGKNFYDMYK